MKEAIIGSILHSVREGLIAKETGVQLCYDIKNMEVPAAHEPSSEKDIAIIGLAGSYPKARNMEELWFLLKEGRDAVSELPAERQERWGGYGKNETGESRAAGSAIYGGFLDGIDEFDPLFFNISPLEAELMDPQERLFLQTAWEALEDAGYSRNALRTQGDGKIGVFAGATWQEYQLYTDTVNGGAESPLITNLSNIANRVSYYFDFKGTSLTVDTACSSSLTAIHLACESLINGSNTMALAGGVNVSVHPNKYAALSRFQFTSSKGRCESFGAGGDGYVPGEGVGVVVLKPLQQAIADNDHIYGVIKSSAINHGGKSNGYTVPNPAAQAQVIGAAWEEAGFDPATISYIEAHGTGTALGDPIEIAGLGTAMRMFSQERQFCAIGSVKSNIGHCESASGIAGLAKVLLQMKHGQLVPSLHADTPNPDIDFDRSPYKIQTSLGEWERPVIDGKQQHRRAGISSFGAGGANAHLVVEEYWPASAGAEHEDGAGNSGTELSIIVLSTKSQGQLIELAHRLLDWLEHNEAGDDQLPHIAYTLQMGRDALEHRLAIPACSIRELHGKLSSFVMGKGNLAESGVYSGKVKRAGKRAAETETALAEQPLSGDPERAAAEGLAIQWTNGEAVAWERLHDGDRRRRVSLPTYPFARERYWVAVKPIGGGNDGRLLGDKAVLSAGHGEAIAPSEGTGEGNAAELLMLEPCWQEHDQPVATEDTPAYGLHIVLLCGQRAAINGDELAANLRALSPASEVRCVKAAIGEEPEDIISAFHRHASLLFAEIQSEFRQKRSTKVLVQAVVAGEREGRLLAGLAGMLRSARLENPRLTGQMIELAGAEDEAGLAQKLAESGKAGSRHHIRYSAGRGYTAGWRFANAAGASVGTAAMPWKEGGVYLITGGAGGLGLLVAEAIAREARSASIYLAGRSPLGAVQEGKLERLRAMGATVHYRRANLASQSSAEQLIEGIASECGGRLNGIIHAAGITRDSYVIKKTEQDLHAVLEPKVDGLVHLDEASRDIPLDFFILFSSGASALGNIGQTDYSAANGFMDAYAQYRSGLQADGRRSGRTLSVNWPLWKDGGMHVDASTAAMMERTTGMVPMRTASGLFALYAGLQGTASQLFVMEGDLAKMTGYMLGGTKPEQQETQAAVPDNIPLPADIARSVEGVLKQMLSDVTKLPVARIDAEEPLESYGIDSIMITQLNMKLEEAFGEVSKTLFFEYLALDALAEYLVADYPQDCLRLCGLQAATDGAADGKAAAPGRAAEPQVPQGHAAVAANARQEQLPLPYAEATREPIAIIGISGRYPQADSLEQFWNNLASGTDCITEISPERWPVEGFYEPNKDEAAAQGKSYSKWGGFLDRFASFDPLFFQMSPREAAYIDPQERLLIEECWAAMEDAGYTRERVASTVNRRVGVFTGITKTGYELYGAELWKKGDYAFPHTSFGSAANRISYLFNLQGPSMPIDTMCSSSLTAIHEACEHLYRGECEMAIAGGVNLYLHPSGYVKLSSLGMLSAEGRCRTFGQGADGFVPGEGVGAVILKPLSSAVRDGDQIHAVIRGTGINHGGKTNGYTVPNPTAQAELVRTVLDRAGVDARAVSYIEAHGTGTELGDPIEITGLSQAFRKDTKDTGFCAIGSAKSNIGHLEAAAGIAGLAKVILQMRHRKLVPSLYADKPNPNIPFAKTPFTVQQALTDWKRPIVEVGGERVECPLIAGISSFGAGGANAHLLVEEYVSDSGMDGSAGARAVGPVAVILSARNAGMLAKQAQGLLGRLQNGGLTDNDLANMAYTLQIGREAMEERLGLVVSSAQELSSKLERFLNGGEIGEGMYVGQAVRGQGSAEAALGDDGLGHSAESLLSNRQYGKLLESWVKGMKVDWRRLYDGGDCPRTISLPTYPFSGAQYWLKEMGIDAPKWQQPSLGRAVAGDSKAIGGSREERHPMVQRNTSTLAGLRFSAVFTGDECFLDDHRVQGKRILPGVAYLEMAYASVLAVLDAESLADLRDGRLRLKLSNIAWLRPLEAEGKQVDVHIALELEDDGEIAFKIYTENEAGEVVHGQGNASLHETGQLEPADWAAISARCANRYSAEQCYSAFSSLGIAYGPSHRGVAGLQVGQGELLAELAWPREAEAARSEYTMHPGMLDSVLQAAIGFSIDNASAAPSLPFELSELEIVGDCSSMSMAWLRYSDQGDHNRPIKLIDIDIADQDGNICLRLRGFASRAKEMKRLEESGFEEKLMLAPVWDRAVLEEQGEASGLDEPVWIIGDSGALRDALRSNYPDACVTEPNGSVAIEEWADEAGNAGVIGRIIWLAPSFDPVSNNADRTAYDSPVLQLFRFMKGLLRAGWDTRDLRWTVVTERAVTARAKDEPNPAHASLHGLVGSAAKEYGNWSFQLIDLDGGTVPMDGMLALPSDPEGEPWVYRDEAWYRSKLVPVRFPAQSARSGYRQGGVYVVIGGAGGIGEVWTDYMLRSYQAQIVWIGRRPLDETIQHKLDKLSLLGPVPHYIAADAGDEQALRHAIAETKARFGSIHGVVHSAIVLLDQSLANMEEERFKAGLAAKVDVSIAMVQAFKGEALDFMLYFSSMQSFSKAAGQSNYASGCTFKDAYAIRTGQQLGCAVRVMNWGYWGSVGIVSSDAYKQRMAQAGVGSIEPDEAMEALEALMASPINQLAFMKLTAKPKAKDGVEEWISVPEQAVAPSIANMLSGVSMPPMPMKGKALAVEDSREAEILQALLQATARVLHVTAEEIDPDADLDDWGVDAVTLAGLAEAWSCESGVEVTSGVCLACATLRNISKYAAARHQHQELPAADNGAAPAFVRL
ncbi:SDR family NAD(P)-dependent oxidoreductase [Paenibacillus sp. MMS18-CY102]|uniref:SDR family NAD(P)-dependent oxidoreductase n=1 Tax=Paenibacillus sp. MMS18-CY102 TaxID=2682849 RepID=UPI0013654DEB|nr:SDR family NAD(P)-dependent oxidoreductase [Paenibacillus sp. MMS18-CY102]MWC28299.1 SDR family NAD(P)-dependent oxidoreductase [Paenibacillus sp. MMS18-CY102]